MGYTRFTDTTTLTDAQDGLVSLSAGLAAYPEEEVQLLAQAIDALIVEGDVLDATLKQARRLVLRAHALVRTWNGVCDDRVREFNKDLLAAVRLDREHPLFKAVFGSRNASDVIDMSLEPEVEVLDEILVTLAKKTTPAELRKTWLPLFQDGVTQGRAALAARKSATAAVASAYDNISRFVERADRARRSVDGKLTSYAADNKLPTDFNERFFPTAGATKSDKKSKKADAPKPDPTP